MSNTKYLSSETEYGNPAIPTGPPTDANQATDVSDTTIEDHGDGKIKRKPYDIAKSPKTSDEDTDEGLSMPKSRKIGKNKKPRRARRRRYRPYYQLTSEERTKVEEREQLRATKIKERMLAVGKPCAPYNTTQFIMNDHGDTVLLLEQKKMVSQQTQRGIIGKEEKPEKKEIPKKMPWVRRQRARDSSFSLDTDEEFFYSSPEDEEDFVSKEFRRDYDNVNVDRLSALEKDVLISEYILMEHRVEYLKKRLEEVTTREEQKAQNGEADYEFERGEVPMSPATAEKIRIFQSEIAKLNTENGNLKKENVDLKTQLSSKNCSSLYKDSDSSSSSSSSESSSDSENSSDEEIDDIEDKDFSSRVDDTGYESGKSGSVSSSEQSKSDV